MRERLDHSLNRNRSLATCLTLYVNDLRNLHFMQLKEQPTKQRGCLQSIISCSIPIGLAVEEKGDDGRIDKLANVASQQPRDKLLRLRQ